MSYKRFAAVVYSIFRAKIVAVQVPGLHRHLTRSHQSSPASLMPTGISETWCVDEQLTQGGQGVTSKDVCRPIE